MTASIYKFCLSGTIYMVKRKEAVNMKLQSITEKQIQKFRKYLINEEKSDATIEKYIRDVTALAYMGQSLILCKPQIRLQNDNIIYVVFVV